MRTGDEIRLLRKKLRLSQEGLSTLIGVSRSAVYDWERDAYSPEGKNLVKLAKALNVSVSYLMGETDDPTPKTRLSEKIEPQGAFHEIIINNGKEYSPENITKNPKSELPVEEKSNVRLGTKFIKIPLLAMATAASCGADNGLYGVIPESTENIFVEASTFACLDDTRKPFAMPIEGDSMIGAGLEEGANAVINPAEDVTNGDVALICYSGNWLIKWVICNPDGSVDLKLANPNYSPMHIESAYASDPSWFRIIGKVVATIKKGFPKRAF
jgi:transcriptional regulator with XRE-family HTH domain